MKATIKKYLLSECNKIIKKHHIHISGLKKNQTRYKKRTGLSPQEPSSYIPSHWELHKHFNPFYVRSRADSIAHSIANKIRNKTYKPNPSVIIEIPKPDGGKRQITISTIPDAAVSLYLFKLLVKRNAQLFSSYSYAYRSDRNAHHAIENLYRNVNGRQRQYILEFDFAKYFDSISHEYVIDVIKRIFKVSPREEYLISQFLKLEKAEGLDNYKKRKFITHNRGVPQGSSISLFLANVACVELDHEIEQTGAIFARYADDTLIVCKNYDVADKCANLMLSHGKRSKTEINFKKSDGISLLTPDRTAEMRCKESFNFLGHNISQTRVTLSERAVRKIKKRISTIIYRHLLLYPRQGNFRTTRIDNNIDWDMVTCVNEIRRYIYGKISEEKLSKCLKDKTEPLVLSRCLLSFYPLVDGPRVFRQLDGWLVNVLHRAQRERKKIIVKFVSSYPLYTKQQILDGSWYNYNQIKNETKLPSFFKSWLYVRKCLNVYGMQTFPNPPYFY